MTRTVLPVRSAALVLTCLAFFPFSTGCNTSAGGFLGNTDTRDSTNNGAQGLSGSPAAPSAFPEAGSADTAAAVARDIEEADVVKHVGDKIYLLNQYKGLVIVDVANPDAPKVLGSLDLRGRGVEMYVVGTQAFVVLSADFGYYYPVVLDGGPRPAIGTDVAMMPAILPPRPDYVGSQLAIIDVSNAAAPSTVDKINLVGFAEQSRRVGSIIYVAGSNLASWEYPTFAADDGTSPPNSSSQDFVEQDRGFVASINVSDPANIVPVERETIRSGALNIHVSTNAIFAAGADYNSNTGDSTTKVQYIDISDPNGAITPRGTFTVPGSIRNRFYMDEFNGSFRICTDNWGFGFRAAKLFTYNVSNPDAVTAQGSVEIIRGESLEAVRYDGNRAYAVTFLRVDPLFIIDLSNPAAPVKTGELEVPGFSTHIEPRGDRLIAVGIDDTNGRRPAVAYYDVADAAHPKQLSRVILGPPNSYTDSQATYDEKAFKIIDGLNMIVIPFNHTEYDYEPQTGGNTTPPSGGGSSSGNSGAGLAMPESVARMKCVNGVQIIDFSDTALTQRGWFDARSRVSRVGQVGTRVYAISDIAIQTLNIDNRDTPVQAGEALFIPETDIADYDGCGYYTPFPIDGPFDPTFPEFTPDSLRALADLLNQLADSGLCGASVALPGGLIAAGMMFMRGGRRRKF